MLARFQATAHRKDEMYVGAISARFVFNHQLLSQTIFYEVLFGGDGVVHNLNIFFKAEQIFGFAVMPDRYLCPLKLSVKDLFINAIQAAINNGGIGEDERRLHEEEYLNIVENLCLSPPVISARPKPR